MPNPEKDLSSVVGRRFARKVAAACRRHEKYVRQWRDAETMVGRLVRDGKTVYYVFSRGGRYREGNLPDLIEFLIRNKYV